MTTKMKKVTITISTARAIETLGSTKTEEISLKWAEHIASITGGCSLHSIKGSYKIEHGSIVTEDSIVYTTFVSVSQPLGIRKLYDFAKAMCYAWDEESVLFVVEQPEKIYRVPQ